MHAVADRQQSLRLGSCAARASKTSHGCRDDKGNLRFSTPAPAKEMKKEQERWREQFLLFLANYQL